MQYLLDLDAVHHHVTMGSARVPSYFLANPWGVTWRLRWLQRKTGAGARAILVSPMLDIQLGSKRPLINVAWRGCCFCDRILLIAPFHPLGTSVVLDNDLTTDAARYEEQYHGA